VYAEGGTERGIEIPERNRGGLVWENSIVFETTLFDTERALGCGPEEGKFVNQFTDGDLMNIEGNFRKTTAPKRRIIRGLRRGGLRKGVDVRRSRILKCGRIDHPKGCGHKGEGR